MLDQSVFTETIHEVAEIIRTSATPLSKEEILSYFKEMELNEQQENMVLEFLLTPHEEEEAEEETEENEGGEQEAADWQRRVQRIVMEKSPHGIPAIFHMEGLCGAFLQEATSYPSGIARGAGFDPELEEKIGASVAKQENACGITHILAPVLDISRDSRMGRQGETYGEDPTLAAALGTAYAKGAAGVTVDGRTPDCVAKHFLAFHNSQGG